MTDGPTDDDTTPDEDLRLVGFDTIELVEELLRRHEAVMIGIVTIDEDCGTNKMKVMYESSGVPELQCCIARDLRYLALGQAIQHGLSPEEVGEIMSMTPEESTGEEGWEDKLSGADCDEDDGEEWKRKGTK